MTKFGVSAAVVTVVAFAVLGPSGVISWDDEPLLYDTFPDGFAWALATASYQIEGAWNEDGKGESIWDRFSHEGDHIADGSSGDVACDSYHKWQEDIALLQEVGVTHYRFSIAWTRILPEGTGAVNQAGIDWYSNFIDALIAAGIEPMVTLYHWDLPQALQEQGGWVNEEIVGWFEEYAAVLFQSFGDRVKLWITFNEPWVFCVLGYGSGEHAPGWTDIAWNPYLCTHNVLKAHGRTYRRYEQEFQADQQGKVGITLNVGMSIPSDDKPENLEAANRSMEFNMGWYAHPIFKGNYPQVMIDLVGQKSSAQGFESSRLPTFTAEEIDMIRGTSDFLGINHYTSSYTYYSPVDPNACISYFCDSDTGGFIDSTWPTSGSSWLKVVPFAFRQLMNYIKDEYDNVQVYITENGFSDLAGHTDDFGRIYYYKHYINQLLKAVKLDGCNVQGYTAWSLMDNFEWARGYTEKFGVHAVDFNDPARPRKMKASAKFLKQIIADNGFVENPSCPYAGRG